MTCIWQTFPVKVDMGHGMLQQHDLLELAPRERREAAPLFRGLLCPVTHAVSWVALVEEHVKQSKAIFIVVHPQVTISPRRVQSVSIGQFFYVHVGIFWGRSIFFGIDIFVKHGQTSERFQNKVSTKWKCSHLNFPPAFASPPFCKSLLSSSSSNA